ncbi:glycosyltransferase family 2 protein [Pararhodobacter oceanensis]|uniref:glycosyltransferase family 2 protein n=1 Tax=Pararhodobacter oceanensis TaxID=2172121 RepID=UPI003A8DE174
MKAETETIGVVIPVYTGERYLDQAIRSVLSQEVDAGIETVVVIDGATDRSAEIAQGYADNGVSILKHFVNRGISAARNTGLALLSTDYLAFIDADDIWPACRLQSMIDALRANPDVGQCFGMMTEFLCPEISEERQATLRHNAKPQTAYCAAGSLSRASVFEKVGGFDEALAVGEYIDWYARAQHLEISHLVVPDLVLKRRIHGANFTVRNKSNKQGYGTLLKHALDRKRAAANGV